MISTRLVVIVGAGGSEPFGFPVGYTLLKELTTTTMPLMSSNIDPSTKHFVSNQVVGFREALKRASAGSIDDFLQDRQDYLKLGKTLIATALVGRENHNSLLNFECNGHWLRYLWQRMKSPPQEFGNNNIAFITYNYDRSIEHFFTTSLANTYNVSLATAYEAVKKISIIHPHGFLAPYLPVDPDTPQYFETGRGYHNKMIPASVDLAAKHIRLFWEQSPEQEAIRQSITDLLGNAEAILFLGFGYLKSNLSHLLPAIMKSNLDRNKVHGTCLGMGDQECARITHGEFRGRVTLHGMDCLTVLRGGIPWRQLE